MTRSKTLPYTLIWYGMLDSMDSRSLVDQSDIFTKGGQFNNISIQVTQNNILPINLQLSTTT